MIEAVVFDIGGVFCEKDMLSRSRVLAQYHVSEEWLDEVKSMPEYSRYKAGYMAQEEFVRLVDSQMKPDSGRAEDLFRDLSYAHSLNSGLVNIAERLRTRCRVAVLSNSDSFLEQRLKYLGVFQLFEFVINSYRVQLRKPDPRIFQHLLERIGLPPEHIIFVDDKPANVNAAYELGIRGHVFSDNADLTRYLATQGIAV